MKRLTLDGGSAAPSPGQTPRGAKKHEMNPASSSMPSDWYDEKSCSTAMHERKSSVASAIASFGQTFTVMSSEQKRPATTSVVNAVSLAFNQKTDGIYQSRLIPGTAARTVDR